MGMMALSARIPDDAMVCVKCGHITDGPYETDYDTPDCPEGWPICPKCHETNIGGYPSFIGVDVADLDCLEVHDD